jgi:exonuclease SbcC
MIPIKLELTNFMAYRASETLDLSGLHVVCLTGDNGAGKSTLLDAITWALWGKARSTRDEELISQGESDMRVALTFSEGTNVYQVIRTRKQGRASKSGKIAPSTGTLELMVYHNTLPRTITEEKQSDTQDKIINMLNLSYDTFINSAFLKQGHADEFAIKTPAERKKLLSEILNLQLWQAYDEKAKKLLDELEREEAIRQADYESAQAEIARLPQYQQELAQAENALSHADALVRQFEAEDVEMNRQRERLSGLSSQLRQIKREVGELDGEMNSLKDEQRKQEGVMSNYQTALDQRAEIEKGFADLEVAYVENDAMTAKLTNLTELNSQKTKVEHNIADARRKLESERDLAERVVADLTKAADDQQWLTNKTQILAELGNLRIASPERETLLAMRDEARDHITVGEANNKQIEKDGKQKKESIEALQRVGAVCPTCRRPLGEEEKAHLIATWNDELLQYRELYSANRDFINEQKARIKVVEQQLAELDKITVLANNYNAQLAALEVQLHKASEAKTQLPNAQIKLETVIAQLAEKNYAQKAQTELLTVNQKLAELGYDVRAHDRLRNVTLPALKPYAERKNQLDRATLGVQVVQAQLAELAQRLAGLTNKQQALQGRFTDTQNQIAACQQVLLRANEVANGLGRAHADRASANRKVGEANQKVASCQALELKTVRLVKQLNELRERKSLLKDLRESFGKNGVPAMIIEVVLPELEVQTNSLLSRMTSGRMGVRFETQREAKSGNVSETLEIRISDELGERPYEMYSGGEAFRINFAIRIALSKLLAHRQGARLQTLFIDEGFGTQDAQGRERLVEAIQAIQDDFERLIIITHLDDLKDAFPARIEVTKTANGSTARIV